ncbi:MAG: hypothetical protein HC853_18785 [Anaerolineae bacterium]|nr:hypothetical protein [Anaerolineae bacterium]
MTINAGFIPIPFKGRELYVPQVGVGRLVETPADILQQVNAFLAQPVFVPTSALVTGYDFLIDQARIVSNTFGSYGVSGIDRLIDNAWTANAFRAQFFGPANARGLNSLNSHFAHNRFFPNDPNDVFASEVLTAATNFNNSLMFSVGCHSGLNVPDAFFPGNPSLATDWPQAFARRGAAFVGNTGFAYGDSELLLYSKKLMVNFATQLGTIGEPPTTGRALMLAKQQYYNGLAAGSFGNYDEKVLGIMTLYGLPMQKVRLPNQPPAPVPPAQSQTYFNLPYTFQSNPISIGAGSYDTVNGTSDVSASGGKPVLPVQTIKLDTGNDIAHGVLWLGGSFADTPNFVSAVSQVVTDQVYSTARPAFPFDQFFPGSVASVNRFLTIDGDINQQLVVVPAQFRADPNSGSPTTGLLRRYTALELQVLTAPKAQADFASPVIHAVEVISSPTQLAFRVRVSDDSLAISRTVVLYAGTGDTAWRAPS